MGGKLHADMAAKSTADGSSSRRGGQATGCHWRTAVTEAPSWQRLGGWVGLRIGPGSGAKTEYLAYL